MNLAPHLCAWRTAIVLTLVLACGCDETVPAEPEPLPSLDTPPRAAGLFWVVSNPNEDAVEAVRETPPGWAPSGIVLNGSAAPALPGDEDPADTAGLDLLGDFEALLATEARHLKLGVQVAALGGASPSDVCFDPADPTSDPTLLARHEGLSELLASQPVIDTLVIGVASPIAPWDQNCTCAPCASTDEQSLAERAGVVFDALSSATEGTAVHTWWWDQADSSRERMTLALASSNPAALRATSARDHDHTWAITNPRLDDGQQRRVAADIDVLGHHFGDAHLLRLSPDDLQDRFRRHRQQGVSTWFATLDNELDSALGRPEEANLHFAGEFFRNIGAEPSTVMTTWVSHHYGLGEGTAAAATLAEGLRHTGRAADMATHPWGFTVAGMEGGMPESLPLVLVEPTEDAVGWAERFERAQHPDTDTLVAVHQWGAEAMSMSEAAVAAVEEVSDLLAEADLEDLRSRTSHLHATTRGLAALTNADFTLRAYQVGPEEELKQWLRSDAATLEALAFEIDSAVALGQWPSAHPLDSAALLAVATQLREAVGAGTETQRGFPTITGIRHDFEDQRINFHWTLSPSGSGWVELGSQWPDYDGSSATGPGPAAQWHAWVDPEPANTRMTYRPCGASGGFQVCSSDRVLWTPP
ncbi:MAG: hypothetical protein CL928_10095 [Deltaproteobacteria bacterium]|nr:hypothetical protein [Deltaproteobacteria bacterium]